jgi:hypothetical protein
MALTSVATNDDRPIAIRDHILALPYGLDVRHGTRRVLRIMWSDDGAVDVMSFVRRQWEDEALRRWPGVA